MKVLSLAQPYASLLFIQSDIVSAFKAKGWETRPWKPIFNNTERIQQDGMLIHASKSIEYKPLCVATPFKKYVEWESLPKGSIIGWVKVGRIISTEQFKSEFFGDGTKEFSRYENLLYGEWCAFGDFTENRYAWEIVETKLFEKPIEGIRGSLSLWNYDENLLPLNYIKSK